MKLEARAKTNLMLTVLAREESGYHQIETLFQLLELADVLTMRVAGSSDEPARPAEPAGAVGEAIVVEGLPVTFHVQGVSAGALGAPAGNLVVRAIGAYLRRFRDRHGTGRVVPPLEVILEKRIPHGAGLGGGSSDAAATLRVLNTLASRGWSETTRGARHSVEPADSEEKSGGRASPHHEGAGPGAGSSARTVQSGPALSERELLEVAAELGSDVPFFFSPSPLTLAWGRGERLLALPALDARPVLLVVPTFAVATADAYAALSSHRAGTAPGRVDGERVPPPVPALRRLDRLAGWGDIESLAQNDFHGPIEALHPRLGRLRSQLSEGGARVALLSGSGSALIGIFADESTRDDMRRALEKEPDLRLIATRTVGPSEPDPCAHRTAEPPGA